MSTVRWILHDPVADETWTMPINPDSGSEFPYRRTFAAGTGWRKDDRVRLFEQKPRGEEFNWSGVIRTQAHYDALLAWASKSNAVTLTDHIGRQLRIYITSFEPVDRKPTRRLSTRWRYTMKSILLEVL